MSRITGKRQSYGHAVHSLGGGDYRISWTYDTKIAGSRLRWQRYGARDVDAAGAVRFCLKWGVEIPLEINTPTNPE